MGDTREGRRWEEAPEGNGRIRLRFRGGRRPKALRLVIPP